MRRNPHTSRGASCGHVFSNDADRNVHFVPHQVFHAILEHHVEHDAGVGALEGQEPIRRDELPTAAGHRHANPALKTMDERGHGFLRGQQRALDHAPVLVQPEADLGGLDAACRAAQQLLTELAFELVQVVAHVGPAHAQPTCRLAQIAGIDDLHQERKRVRIHRHPIPRSNPA